MNKTGFSKTRIITESAIMLAIATILSLYPKIDGIWPNGGSITICSMLPIVIVSYRHGIKWGLLAGFAFGVLNIATGALYTPANTLGVVTATVMLDYILPYTAIGLGGIFRNIVKKPSLSLILGVFFSFTIRYLCHVASGYILWHDIAYATEILSSEKFAFGLGPWLSVNLSGEAIFTAYNLLYNASYMLPELIITSAGAILFSKIIINTNTKCIESVGA